MDLELSPIAAFEEGRGVINISSRTQRSGLISPIQRPHTQRPTCEYDDVMLLVTRGLPLVVVLLVLMILADCPLLWEG